MFPNATTITRYSNLTVGDILIVEGMRVRIDSIATHPGASTTGRDLVVGSGTILNRDYVILNPAIFGGIIDPDRAFTVQGIPTRAAVIEA